MSNYRRIYVPGGTYFFTVNLLERRRTLLAWVVMPDADLHAHIDYIHANPMKHGCVGRVCDWPHSSFHGYVARGVLPIDWAGEVAGPMWDAKGEMGIEVSGGGL